MVKDIYIMDSVGRYAATWSPPRISRVASSLGVVCEPKKNALCAWGGRRTHRGSAMMTRRVSLVRHRGTPFRGLNIECRLYTRQRDLKDAQYPSAMPEDSPFALRDRQRQRAKPGPMPSATICLGRQAVTTNQVQRLTNRPTRV